MLSCLVVQKSHYFSHNLHYYNTFLPSLTQTTRLVPGLMKARLLKKRNVLWLVSCPSALWLANSLDVVSILPRPLPKQQGRQYCHIRFRPREYSGGQREASWNTEAVEVNVSRLRNISTPVSTVTPSGHFQVLLWNSVDKETVKRIDEL